MSILTDQLRSYGPTNPKKKKSRQEVLDNAKRLYNARNGIIKAFESKIFLESQIEIISLKIWWTNR